MSIFCEPFTADTTAYTADREDFKADQTQICGLGLSGIGIGLAKPIDIVIQSPYWLRDYAVQIPKMIAKQLKRPARNDDAEILEMMQMYAQWRKVA